MKFKVDLTKYLIDDCRREVLRLWSIRVAMFWGAVSGLFVVWPALSSAVPLPLFAGLSVVMSVALTVARLTKQPGASND